VTVSHEHNRFLLAGLMGWPVMHSRSPALHGFLMRQHDLTGAFALLAIPPDGLEAALRAMPALKFSGCNLTIPHKETAMAMVDRVDDAAKKIGAINCVTVEADGSLSGANHDSFGYVEGLIEAVPDLRLDEGAIAVVGAGGGARGVVYGLLDRGAQEVRLVNRHRDRAETLRRDIGGPISVFDWDDRAAVLVGASLLVNTTSQGMVGNPPLDLPLDKLPPTAVVSDIVYTPRITPLLAAARDRGNRIVDGIGMLLHQARPAWRSWFGIDPKITPELRAAIEATL